jgi:hypothetical protein
MHERVIWRPMKARGGGVYVQTTPTPDDERPTRGEFEEDPLYAVVTWNMGAAPVTPGQGGGVVGTIKLLVDFESSEFTREDYAAFGYPRKGDRIEMPEEPDPDSQILEVERTSTDGTAHLLCWCAVVRS